MAQTARPKAARHAKALEPPLGRQLNNWCCFQKSQKMPSSSSLLWSGRSNEGFRSVSSGSIPASLRGQSLTYLQIQCHRSTAITEPVIKRCERLMNAKDIQDPLLHCCTLLHPVTLCTVLLTFSKYNILHTFTLVSAGFVTSNPAWAPEVPNFCNSFVNLVIPCDSRPHCNCQQVSSIILNYEKT